MILEGFLEACCRTTPLVCTLFAGTEYDLSGGAVAAAPAPAPAPVYSSCCPSAAADAAAGAPLPMRSPVPALVQFLVKLNAHSSTPTPVFLTFSVATLAAQKSHRKIVATAVAAKRARNHSAAGVARFFASEKNCWPH